jgi:hypothetical protein
MRHGLHLHPDSICLAASHIEVDLERPEPGRLRLRYRVSGDIPRLRLPPVTASARADDLWRTTCFEVFIRPGDSPAYYEFNFAPSTQWAAYGFSDRRTGMRVADEIAPPRVQVRTDPAGFELEVLLNLEARAFPPDRPWRLGLSAVIEDTGGGVSYWALAHPARQPDFHHPEAFALELAAIEFP